ncbi:ribonuclease E/G [Devosia sp. 63-57]|uniref:Rne/Rng family ribonuclease n=1 Tax=Devosia sp. 63-57 TaxID=1895751 RepID=UPI00086850D4|nr:ribonuclease E/G [Devosia sp. 63-57]ODT50149.1 MAG: ribonuclease E [Pelagibacterium sp. SCN 63-126]OJX44891.1 MAG: ribonuclease E/G [Devosia sp. 63-57]
MATKRMLVDAIHPEETRIVVTAGNRLEEFDFESATRRQLRGNIYLAKVTRVEPSLQAAFVEYGGNRHGFLAFSEIHPDYYQIPVADREALLRDEEHEDESHDDAEDTVSVPEGVAETDAEADPQEPGEASHIEQAPANSEPVESIGGADALEEVPERRRSSQQRRHQYKIQEVIKRRQVMLVQVVKEERGNKGAALTTYLSLAGRYSVLMPNTARGGGISRKITNAADRKRLKEITSDLEVPQGMGVILRTAGASRTKAEVKRDFEYLMRLWESVRTLTLQSQAPCLVYEEGSLIKRTIRDLYNKDIDEVLVAGDNAYREAKDFMKMIMPSHAKNVKPYGEEQPLFSKFGVENQLDQMFSPVVTLPSGGYIVINPTEALVSIDVNSGRSTKEHNIEDTALQTNLEAADEVARQLRLRDLAGLIVIDFIDMMENRSNRAVERKLKDCLKDDRARIQVGRISHFGLMEMSRQRIRFGVVESSTHKCPVCEGTGLVRSTESLALMIMRHIEDHVLRKQGQSINVRVPTEVALYILNYKRDTLTALEARNALSITITADSKLTGQQFGIEKGETRVSSYVDQRVAAHVRVDSAVIEDDVEEEIVDDADESEETEARADNGEGEGNGRRRRRRRRRGGNGERSEERAPQQQQAQDNDAEAAGDTEEGDEDDDSAENGAARNAAEGDGENRRRRRRGRRGGRRNRRDQDGEANGNEATENGDTVTDEAATAAAPAEAEAAPAVAETTPAEAAPASEEVAAEPVAEEKPKRKPRARKPKAETAEAAPAEAAPATEEAASEPAAEEKPKRKPRARKPKAEAAEATTEAAVSAPAAIEAAPAAEPTSATAEPAPEAKPARTRRVKKELPPEGVVVTSSAAPAEETPDSPAESEGNTDGEPDKKKKVGWWQRRLGLG